MSLSEICMTKKEEQS